MVSGKRRASMALLLAALVLLAGLASRAALTRRGPLAPTRGLVDLVGGRSVGIVGPGTASPTRLLTADDAVAPATGSTNTGQVTSTLVLQNNSLVPGVYLPTEGGSPIAMAVDSKNGFVYVADRVTGNLAIIDPARNAVAAWVSLGGYPVALEFDPGNGRLYVADMELNRVVVLDCGTNEVLASIRVGDNPSALARNTANGDIYVANYGSENLSVVSTATNRVVDSIALDSYPEGVAYDSANGDLYVTGSAIVSGTTYYSNVTVVNGTTNGVESTIPLSPQSGPQGVKFDGTNGDIYVANPGNDSVAVIGGRSNTIIAYIPVGANPFSLAVVAATGEIYVANKGYIEFSQAGNVTAIDPSSNKPTAWISAGSSPQGIAFDAATGNLYVANYGSWVCCSFAPYGNVTVVNGTTNRAVAWVRLESTPAEIAVDGASGEVFVTNPYSYDVAALDSASSRIVSWIPAGWYPGGIVFDPLNGNMYVANFDSGNISEIDGSTNRVTGSFSAGFQPAAIAFDSFNSYLYVVNSEWNGRVTVIDTATNSVVQSVSVGIYPVGIAYDAARDRLYVVNAGTCCPFLTPPNVTVIDAGTNTVAGSIPLPLAFPYGYGGSGVFQAAVNPAIDPETGEVFLSAPQSSNVTVINGSTNTAVDSIPVGSVSGLAFDSSNGYVYVASVGAVEAIDGRTNSVVETYPVRDSLGRAASLVGIGVNAAGQSVYATSIYSGTLFVIPSESLPEYRITFAETGLAVGSSWSVTINGILRSTSDASITFTAPNGTYHFDTNSALGYLASPSSGIVSVAGGSVTVSLAFHPGYPVTFSEVGLPAGTAWSVSLAGRAPVPSQGNSISFRLWNGTYAFSVGPIPGYVSSPSAGSVTISGVAVTQPVIFTTNPGSSSPTYDVTFTEVGLAAGTIWQVTLGGSTHTSPVGFLTFAEPNGTYSYSVGIVTGYSADLTQGTVTVSGESIDQFVAFAPIGGSSAAGVGFTLLGLPVWASYALILAPVAMVLFAIAAFLVGRMRRRRRAPPARAP